MAFYCCLFQPVGWVSLVRNIHPTKYRGLGVSAGAFSNWFFNAVVAFTFLKMAWLFTSPDMEIIRHQTVKGVQKTMTDPNPAGSFFVYAAVAFLGILWGLKYIPETKGKTLEDIERHWRAGNSPKSL